MNTRFTMILMVSIATALASTVVAGEGKEKVNADKKAAFLKEFDKDGDGKLSQEEKTAMHEARKQKMLKEFDKDGDGKLNDEEKKAMQEARKQHGEKKGHDKKKKDGGE